MAASTEIHVTRGDGGKEYPSAGILAVTNAPPIYKSVEELTAYFGDFGGRFIPETLMEAHTQLEQVSVSCVRKLCQGQQGLNLVYPTTASMFVRNGY